MPPPLGAARPDPLPLALGGGGGSGEVSPRRHTRYPVLDAGIALALLAAQPTPPPPLFLFFCRTPPPAAHNPRAPAEESTGHQPPLGPAARRGCGPDSGTAARNLRRSWACGNNSARPCLPAAAPAPASSRGGARTGSCSLRPGAPRGRADRGSPAGEAPAAIEPSGAGNGTRQLPPAEGPRLLSKS